jgi:hypothetical protein
LHFYLKHFCATMGNFHKSESRQPRQFNLYHNGMANFHNSKSCQSRQFNLNHNGIGNCHNSESPQSRLDINRF